MPETKQVAILDMSAGVAKLRMATPADQPLLQGQGSYVHTQASPSAAWTVVHDLDTKLLDIHLFDQQGQEVFAGIDWSGAALDRIDVHFSIPVAGKACVRAL
jgi:hypothetical protein